MCIKTQKRFYKSRLNITDGYIEYILLVFMVEETVLHLHPLPNSCQIMSFNLVSGKKIAVKG